MVEINENNFKVNNKLIGTVYDIHRKSKNIFISKKKCLWKGTNHENGSKTLTWTTLQCNL